MKVIRLILLSSLLGAAAAAAGSADGRNALGAGVRVLQRHDLISDLPFDKGDLAYGVAYEFHDAAALWQLACFYAPTVGDEKTDVNYAIAPELNLLFKDSIWRGGLGILDTYVDSDATGGDWTGVYWQIVIGIDIPIGGRFHLAAQVNHVFDEWKEIGRVDVAEFEYTGLLSMRF